MGSPIPLALAAYKRTLFPEAVALNVFVEKAPTQQSSAVAMLARPGQEAFRTVGNNPLRAIFTKAGLFANAALVLASTTLYTLDSGGGATALSGTIAGSGRVDVDAGQDADLNSVARFATGTALYSATGGVVTNETATFGDGVSGASSICYHRSKWIGLLAGTDQFYVLLPGGTWDPLEFATNEYAPDPGVAVRSRGDQVVFLNAATTEVWTDNSGADAATVPLVPYGGLNFDYGCRARDTAVNCQGALLWVDNNCSVRMFQGGEPEIISDNGLAEQIRRVDSMELRASTFSKDQHVFYVLTLGSTATWVYDLTTQNWTRFSSGGYDYWRPHLFANIGDLALACDSTNNQVWKLDPDRRTDDDDTFTVVFRAFVEVAQPTPCASIRLNCEVGNSPLSGQGSAPLIRMRFSDDGAKTFGRWYDRSLGATGKYKTRVQWNALGTIYPEHGRIFEFQVSDPVGRRFSSLMMNAV